MKIFECDHCGQTVYFDNEVCVACGHRLGFDPQSVAMYALKPVDSVNWHKADETRRQFRFCQNAGFNVCNWLLPEGSDEPFCPSCRHNNLIPDTGTDNGLARFGRIVAAERHLFYSLLRWNVETPTRGEDPDGGLVFDFLEDTVDQNGNLQPAMTGHENGLISLRVAEADDVTREIARQQMNEPYRTLLGHFRHEVGHYVWDRLVRDGGRLEEFRSLFGDEREDYQAALQRHYENGPSPGWPENFVSAYASTHPWEDFAESFAHALHIVDTLETARAFGLMLDDGSLEPLGDPYSCESGKRLADAWVPLTLAMNAIHKSMGQRDFYPFVLTPEIIRKLDFVLGLLVRQTKQDSR
ncbi:putative zinc-binding peptidase [Martelella lutilitoris]|uniref:Putative zinc-binding peptidase n=1 Tax=Martelella lutilitoris TaxID=2583532 RepID=A0A7T7HMH5_9HYPH|nr:putative zinc-binding peptidase [Martelella lutilitoris]QQM31798.1 putative zinc-binding peptidase [Martelella lutilitoris]